MSRNTASSADSVASHTNGSRGTVAATASRPLPTSTTNVLPTLPVSMGLPVWFTFATFFLLFLLLLKMRVRLEEQRARLDALYLSADA